MQKLGLVCPLGFLASKTPRKKTPRNKTTILDLNYDCHLEIFSYLSALDDKINLARAHPQFREVLARQAPWRNGKINMRMLRCISDWEYLLPICGSSVLECELRHGHWDADKTMPFLDLLNVHCKNLRHLHILFVRTDTKPTEEDGDVNLLQRLDRKDLKSLSLTDAEAADVLQVQRFNELHALHIDGFDYNLTNTGFVQLIQSLPALRRLSLRFADRRPYPSMSDSCPFLEHMSLENFEATINDIGDFPKLQSLRLVWRLSVHVNNNLLCNLGLRYADRLEQLHITKVNAEQVAHIVTLGKLKSLACNVWPSESLAQLTKLSQLECLVLQCGEDAVSLMRLLDIVRSCSKLKHLKLGKRWQMAELDLFVSALQDELSQQSANGTRQILLSLEMRQPPGVQITLREDLSQQLVQLDWLGTVCRLCRPDRHTKTEVFQDLGLNLPHSALAQW